MSTDETFAHAARLLHDGQTLEARPTPASLASAIRCYEQAIATLRALPLSDARVRHQLAIAAMNRGNALQRQNTPETLVQALNAYDEAIAFFRTLPLEDDPDARNSLGAAWMNRGHAAYLQAEASSFVDAVHSQTKAVALLQTLPLDAHPSYRANLAAAWLNQSNALLAIEEDDRALEAARESARVAAPRETENPSLADIGLKARRAECEAIGRLLFRASRRGEPTDALADAASDLVDDGLALARRWHARGFPHFRSVAVRLFAFGAQLYRLHLPDFLGEFLLEHIDPERSAGAMCGSEDFYWIAADSLSQARIDLESRHQVFLDTPETARLLERLQTLREADARLKELCLQFPPATLHENRTNSPFVSS